MSNFSLIKCIFSLLVISLYVWLFRIVGVIGETNQVFAGDSNEFKPELNDVLSDTGIINPPEPALVSYSAYSSFSEQTTTPLYISDISSASSISDTSVSDTALITNQPAILEINSTPAPVTSHSSYSSTTGKISDIQEIDYADLTKEDKNAERFTVLNGDDEVTDTALNIISKIVQNEVGSAFEKEAIKAQAVATYTYVKMRNMNGAKAVVNMASAASDRVSQCVKDVLGQAIYYDGKLISAVYCSSSAGHTASSENIWGEDLPYLQSVSCPLDERFDPNYGVNATMTSHELMTQIVTTTGIDLSDSDPSDWIKILNHVDTVYVGDMSVGGQTSYTKNGETVKITGRTFREKIMAGKKFRSAAFEVRYNKDRDTFTFTTYGYGHGAGMSQNGANALAKHENYDYKQILAFYYKNTEIY